MADKAVAAALEEAKKALLAMQETIYLCGYLSDLKIVYGDRTFDVHKAIVCSQSKIFEASYIEATSEQGSQAIAILQDDGSDDPETIGHMIRFFYTGEYSVSPLFVGEGPDRRVSEENRALSQHARILAAAVKHDVVLLQQLAFTYHQQAIARKQVVQGDLAEAMGIIFAPDTPHFDGMRRVSAELLFASPAAMDDERIKAAIDSTPGAGSLISREGARIGKNMRQRAAAGAPDLTLARRQMLAQEAVMLQRQAVLRGIGQ